MHRHPYLGFLISLALAAMSPISAGAQWTQFRGSNAGDVGDDPGLPETWSETENVVWKIDVPGLSWSSPVVWEDTIFLTSAIVNSSILSISTSPSRSNFLRADVSNPFNWVCNFPSSLRIGIIKMII